MIKNIYILFALAIAVTACKKAKIETLPASNSPVFHLDGKLGTQSIQFHAGDDGMVMKNGVEVRNGVDYAFGEMTDGITSIKLGIFDGNLAIESMVASIHPGDSLALANKFTQSLANLSKGNFSNDAFISNVDWYVNGLFKGSNQVFIDEPGLYDVCGNFTFLDGTQQSVCNKLYLGFKDDVEFSIKHFLSDNGDAKLWVEGDTQFYDSVVWQIDNQIIATGVSHSTNIGNEERTISATVHHQNGAVRKKSIVIDGTFSGHFIEDFGICEIPTSENLWDYSTGLEVKFNGDTFSSFAVTNQKNKLYVKDIQLHEVNGLGQKIARISIDGDVMLKSINTGLLKPFKFEAIFAYPLPQ